MWSCIRGAINLGSFSSRRLKLSRVRAPSSTSDALSDRRQAEKENRSVMMQLSELAGPPLPDDASTINGSFQQNVQTYPDTVALVCTHQLTDLYGTPSSPLDSDKNEASYLRWTYRDLDHAIQRFANGLRRRGLRQGNPLLLFLNNTAEYVIATLAAYRIGCVHVPINPRSLSHTREVQHMLQTVMKGTDLESIATVAGSADLCSQVEELTSELDCVKVLVEGDVDGWLPFGDLMQEPAVNGHRSMCRDCEPEPLESSIFFTSGTTSLPKGCFVQTHSYPFAVATRWRQSNQPMLPGDSVAIALPNNHAFSYLCLMSCFINAATVVLPGPGFAPEAVIRAIQQEQCSHTAFVPTMVLALSGITVSPGQKLTSLRRVVLGGASPNEEVIRVCFEHLGASGVENLYGMTEGVLVSSDVAANAGDIINETDISIGSPFPSGKVRVCAEGSRTTLPVGLAGEVHFSGPTLIDGYIARVDDDKFYTGEDGKRWFRTGDKVIMGKDDRLYLIGRYKETIIRGGENIEPSAIEAVLGQVSEFSALDPQIVRVPDRTAGEVPVAVVNRNISEDAARRLKDTILAKMGSMYVPAAVVAVQSLGSKTYPKTTAGKIQKSKLEDLAKTHWERRSQSRYKVYTRCLLESRLKNAWAQLSGLNDASLIDVNAGLEAFVRDLRLGPLQRKIWKDVASDVPFDDWAAADSIAAQAQLIELARQSHSKDCGNLVNGHSATELPGSRIMESLLSAIAEEKGSEIDPATRMVDLGVDSILSITILNRVQKETGVSLPSSLFFTQETLGAIIDRLCSISNPADLSDLTSPTDEAPCNTCFSTLLQGTPKPGAPSLFLTPPGSGYAFWWEPLPKFANDLAVFALGSPFLMTKSEATWTVEEAAIIYMNTIRSLAPGPYILGGFSMGAITAYEVAYELHQQGERVLGIINLDMPLSPPDPTMPEPTVELLEIAGFYPPIRREGRPDMEIPAYRRQHSASSARAKMKYSPRPIKALENGIPVPKMFIIWAGRGDHDRLPSVLREAKAILDEYGPGTQKRTDQGWMHIPRESFSPGGWAEMVGEENVECHVVDHTTHDSMMDPEVMQPVADLMQLAISMWLSL